MATNDMQQLSAKERNLFKLILGILESSGLLELFFKVLKNEISKKKKEKKNHEENESKED